jgi:hypothetical protein
MEILDSNILLFRNIAPKSILSLIDSHLSNLQVNDYYTTSVLSDSEKMQLTKFINQKIDPTMFDYYLNFKAAARPDLSSTTWKHFVDMEWYNKTGHFKNLIRDNYTTNITYASALMLHRANTIYEGDCLKILANLDRFAYHIGASEDSEHDSKIEFPLQRVSVKLNRGDVLIAPGSISHPYIMTSIVNGKFKFLEAS